MDEEAEVYLFGSAAEGAGLLAGDVDVLVVTDLPPGRVLAGIWEAGIGTPFEVHVVTKDALEEYARRARLSRVG